MPAHRGLGGRRGDGRGHGRCRDPRLRPRGGERRHGQQDRHLPAGGAGPAPRHPVLRRRSALARSTRPRRTDAAIVVEERDASTRSPASAASRARRRPCGVWNPAFDVTPAELITAFITERGVLRATVRPIHRRGAGRRGRSRGHRAPETAARDDPAQRATSPLDDAQSLDLLVRAAPRVPRARLGVGNGWRHLRPDGGRQPVPGADRRPQGARPAERLLRGLAADRRGRAVAGRPDPPTVRVQPDLRSRGPRAWRTQRRALAWPPRRPGGRPRGRRTRSRSATWRCSRASAA